YPSLGYPSSEVAARWRKLPVPEADHKATAAAARAACVDIEKFVTTWPSWLFSRGDVAAGGAGDESPLQLTEASLKTEASHHFTFNVGGRGGRGRGLAAGPANIYLNVALVNPGQSGKPVVIWHNPTVAFRRGGPGRGQPAQPA